MDEKQPEATVPIGFPEVLNAELDLIAARRGGGTSEGDRTNPYRRARAMNLAALAFSGGGIRSAVFNLGFLQGLANRKAVRGFDYLSTVSGGGYVGAWLSALLHRKKGDSQADDSKVHKLEGEYLATPPLGDIGGRENSGFPPPESAPVRFLRRYADYLDPRLGLSGDTLALVSLMVRNVAVIQMMLVSMLVAVFALLLLAGRAGRLFSCWEQPMAGGVGLILVALTTALWWSQRTTREKGQAGLHHPNTVIFFGVLLPALLSGVLIVIGLDLAAQDHAPVMGGLWVAVPVAAYGLAWLFTLRNLRAWVGMLGGAATLGGLLYLGMEGVSSLVAGAPFGHAIAFAPPVALALQGGVITVHLALAGSSISEQNREWWARAGGQGMFLALAWALAFCFLLYAPPLIAYGAEWSIAGGGLWVALSWIGTRLARGKDTDGRGGAPWKEIAALMAPWVFLAGMLAVVAWAFVATLPWVSFDGCCTLAATVEAYQGSLGGGDARALGIILGVAGGLFGLLVVFVDLNIFSAHSFYRNRLARTFMGASRKERKPNAFTGFDPEDDLKLDALAAQRPLHLINTNLNLTGGEELAWQTRRGASFLLSPLYCGYSTSTTLGAPIGGYRPTAEYGGGLSLATAVAVSGAAVSPNMGFHTSTSVAALLTAFNLRLARWCPNPMKENTWRKESPALAAWPLFAELFGGADGRNAWLNLSDGGHFDNLGLYELVRRRAALIIATDVAADGDYDFDDLAMVVRKLSVDFGVELQIDEAALDDIRPPAPAPGADPDTPPRFSKKHWAFGRICYPDGSDPGYLIYVKSSLTQDAPVDIRQYRDAHPDFPHESTADQWFDEDQFEAYRHLGQDIAEHLLDGLLKEGERGLSASELAHVLYERAKEALDESRPHGPCPATPRQGGRL